MTVRELIELNPRIVDIEITVRENGNMLVDFMAIGPDAGVEPPFPQMIPNVKGAFNGPKHKATYKRKSINAWDDGNGGYKEGKRFLHVSTDEVYGSLPDGNDYFYETTPYDPHSPYSASKASSDFIVKSYVDTYHFPAIITNCSNNYGPYQFPEKLIPLIINNILSGKKLPVYGDGKNVRDWLYVMDHAKAIDMACEKGRLGEKYNVGGHNEKQNLDVVHTICDLLDEIVPKDTSYREQITYVADRPGHDRRYAIDADKISRELGWKPQETFESGIRKTVQWYLDNQQWVANVKSGAYQSWIEQNYESR